MRGSKRLWQVHLFQPRAFIGDELSAERIEEACANGVGKALGEAIISLLADPARRATMRQTASEFVRRQFSREKMAEGMEALYQRLLDYAR